MTNVCKYCGALVEDGKSICTACFYKQINEEPVKNNQDTDSLGELELIRYRMEMPVHNIAHQGKRIGNYIIDTIAVYILILSMASLLGIFGALSVFEKIIGNLSGSYAVFFVVYFVYYIVLEGFTGKTLGKAITKTRVITIDGNKATFGTVFIRTICRLIPFEQFSFLGSKAVGWHDSISKTYVINDK